MKQEQTVCCVRLASLDQAQIEMGNALENEREGRVRFKVGKGWI